MDEVITVAMGNYDRTQPLITGEVGVPSVDLRVTPMTTGPMLASAARAEFDVTEHSLASYVTSLSAADRPYVAIPVFPSRMFRHNAVYVHRDADFARPEDLIGARIGIQAWHITAMVWIRGIFADEHGVAVDSVSYVLGGLDTPGTGPARPISPPAGVRIETAPVDRSLVDLLRDREIDAIYAPGAPAAFGRAGLVRSPPARRSAAGRTRILRTDATLPADACDRRPPVTSRPTTGACRRPV